MASSLLLVSPGGALAQGQGQSDAKSDAPAAASPRDSGLQSRRGGIGRDQFIAPVMGIQIEGDGLNLPPGVNEDEPPPKPAAEEKPQETKQEEPRSISK